MIDKQKTDVCLGLQVRDYLVEMGVETPMEEGRDLHEPLEDKKKKIEGAMASIMQTLGLSLEDDSLKETPRRIAKMYLEEIFAGLDYRNFPKVTTIENKMCYSTFLLERHIAVKSVCVPGKQVVNAVGNKKFASELSVGDKLWTLNNGVPVQTTIEKISTHTAKSLVQVTRSN